MVGALTMRPIYRAAGLESSPIFRKYSTGHVPLINRLCATATTSIHPRYLNSYQKRMDFLARRNDLPLQETPVHQINLLVQHRLKVFQPVLLHVLLVEGQGGVPGFTA